MYTDTKTKQSRDESLFVRGPLSRFKDFNFALKVFFNFISSIIFDWFHIRAKEGNYVLFIVWANFVANILYLIAAHGFIKRTEWTFGILIVALIILFIAFGALQSHLNNGGVYESKTVKASIFKMRVTSIFSLAAYFKINNPKFISITKV
ncbi:MAG: hypothetical protein WA749_05105 [Gelidibacter sp.]